MNERMRGQYTEMDRQSDDLVFLARRAVRPLSVLVVGAGIGGLAIGLFILEKRKEITEVGGGIQLAPNATRILRRFGVLDEVMKHATVLERNSLRRWKDGEELGSVPLAPDVEEHFGAPLAVVHRADLQRVLLDAAIGRLRVRSYGMDIYMSADLVLAADGMNSIVRRQMALASGHVDELVSAVQEVFCVLGARPDSFEDEKLILRCRGVSAYRFLLHRELIEHDEMAMNLLNKNQGMRFMGPGCHIMAYPLRKNTLYNVVLVRADKRDTSRETSWTTHGVKEEVLEQYRTWCPIVQALVNHIPLCGLLKTPMSNMPPLPTWARGQIALAGDACHYMFPYVAQGAANAIEDAGTLAMAFTCTDQIELALDLYQIVRKDRSERIQASATNTGKILHLPDGEEQRRRDESIRGASRGKCANPDQWNDRQSREFMWRVDVMAETINRFESLAKEKGINGDA
ncbi:hypothetical protein NUW58_g90 [Xylaria curta]|uniref:Uncharacterized protein n=1 Tax=Xylaria curta TaxID=42375 RepID=A0ACC1PTA6_9PEZI|nr:hypothetical protein NUW58_g90 [Xylaria curta]